MNPSAVRPAATRLVPLRRGHWAERTAALDPESDYAEIYRILALHEFPWDVNQSLSFALFRTYAVPSIGDLLDRTGEFTSRCQRRYDDTALLLEAPLVHGFTSPEGRTGVRRINQMHRMYDISDDDLRYVLATFVVVPVRWIDDHGWRRLSDGEVRASVNYYRELGRMMGISAVPETYDDFATLMDDYEAAHFGFHPGARRVADATLALMVGFYPRPAARVVEVFSRALMDPPLARGLPLRRARPPRPPPLRGGAAPARPRDRPPAGPPQASLRPGPRPHQELSRWLPPRGPRHLRASLRQEGRRPDATASALAGGAEPEELEGVADVGEAVLLDDRAGPPLHGGTLDLDRATAAAADEVVVVGVGAAAVDRLAGLGEDVDLPGLGHRLQGAVDRREADRLPVGAQRLVDLLRAAEVVGRRELGRDRATLSRRTLGGRCSGGVGTGVHGRLLLEG